MSVADPTKKNRRPGYTGGLPENKQYVDTGCDYHPKCLSCPLERCRFDDHDAFLEAKRKERYEAVVVGLEGGASADDLAKQFKISRRTVFRIQNYADGGGGYW